MKLEEAIKQKSFRSESHKLNINLIYTYSWIVNYQKSFYEDHGLTMQQYNVLRILRGNYPDPYSTHMIRDRMLDKMSDVSRIVDRLCKKGLVESSKCKTDKRLVDVTITEKGLSLLKSMDKKADDLESMFNNLSSSEQKKMNERGDVGPEKRSIGRTFTICRNGRYGRYLRQAASSFKECRPDRPFSATASRGIQSPCGQRPDECRSRTPPSPRILTGNFCV